MRASADRHRHDDLVVTANQHYDQLLAAHYTWMLGGDIGTLIAEQLQLLCDLGITAGAPGTLAVDLGCGPGNQTLALVDLGFSPVLAIDNSATLLGELVVHARGAAAVQPVHADIRTALPEVTQPGTVALAVCMGDTLTHLSSKDEVRSLLEDIVRALTPGGRLVLTYRDLTEPLRGSRRFIPVRSTADKIMTCFLEYQDEESVLVHDLIHTRGDAGWALQVSSYPKLRISPDWLADRCRAAGLDVLHSDTGPRGMQVLLAGKA